MPVEPAKLATGSPLDQSGAPGNPQVIVAVRQQGNNHIAAQASGVQKESGLAVQELDHTVVAAYQKMMLPVLAHHPHGSDRKIWSRCESSEFTGLVAAEINARDHPQDTRFVRIEAGDIVIRQSILHRISAELATMILR